jgi:hypothetical protein
MRGLGKSRVIMRVDMDTIRTLIRLFTRDYVTCFVFIIFARPLPASPSFLGIIGHTPVCQVFGFLWIVSHMVCCSGTTDIALAFGMPGQAHGLLVYL